MSARPDIVLVQADKRELPVDIALSTTGNGAERLAVASVRDASVRRAAEVAQEREYRFLAAMNEITAALFTGREVDETLRAIAQRSRKLIDADLALVTVPHVDGELHVTVADGHGSDKLEGLLMSREESLAGTVMREHEPVMITDAANDPRVHRPPGWPEDLGPALFVPLHARDETLGSLTIANRQGRAMFRPADVTLMRAFSAHATLAILDARAQQQLRRVALLEDRERVALAMHDSVINRISSASLTLHTALGASLPESVVQRISEAVDELDAAISSIRDAVFPR